jgi:hypothetical protein
MPCLTPLVTAVPSARAVLVAALCLAGGRAQPAIGAESVSLPPAHQALILLRTLAYDRTLRTRAPERVTVAVAHAKTPSSEAVADAIVAALNEVAQRAKVAGRPLRAVKLAFVPAALEADLRAAGATALYAAPGLTKSAAAIAAVTRHARVLSFTSERDGVAGGLAIALVPRGDRTGLIVSLAAARAEGADLDAALLRIAEVQR